MEVIGICSSCGKPARYTCNICGRLVCFEHYERENRICKRCSPKNEARERIVDLQERMLLH